MVKSKTIVTKICKSGSLKPLKVVKIDAMLSYIILLALFLQNLGSNGLNMNIIVQNLLKCGKTNQK